MPLPHHIIICCVVNSCIILTIMCRITKNICRIRFCNIICRLISPNIYMSHQIIYMLYNRLQYNCMSCNIHRHIHTRRVFTSSENVGYYLAPQTWRMLQVHCNTRNSQNGEAHSKHRMPTNMSPPRHPVLP